MSDAHAPGGKHEIEVRDARGVVSGDNRGISEPHSYLPDDLTYDLERLRLLVLADESAGLDEWEVAMAEFRDADPLDDC